MCPSGAGPGPEALSLDPSYGVLKLTDPTEMSSQFRCHSPGHDSSVHTGRHSYVHGISAFTVLLPRLSPFFGENFLVLCKESLNHVC